MIENTNIYISTSDNYHHCLQPFAYLFNKFWSSTQKVIFLGYKEPTQKLPSNFSFISLGEQLGPEWYANDLRKFFESINDKQFIYTMEDQFILDYVDVDLINTLISQCAGENVGRACLTNSIFQTHMNKKHDPYKQVNDYELVSYAQNSAFRITCEWSVWDKEYMCSYLKDGLDPWQFERISSDQSIYDGTDLIGCKSKVAIQHAEAIRRKNTGKSFDYRLVNENRELDMQIQDELELFIKGQA
mgnify:CR=1 FL=1|tara:strand:- start:1229 stop:1960 length:732 start_codon:yes stop_codon:yes gene_type:complete